jgi:hypothetical protein
MTELNLSSPLRDLIDIPESIDSSDFVLQLHDGVEHASRTLSEYVVTDSIAASIDDALALVDRTVKDRKAKGAFIHGSFGSGKSHFMAVLHLLLTGNIEARKLPGLSTVVDKRRDVLGRNLLAIDYHLLGARTFEEALFTGYLRAVNALHPDAPSPMLHVSDGLLRDAARMRASMKDDTAFFAAISTDSDSGWGELAAAWDANSFDAAIARGGAERERLVRDLVATQFTAFAHAGEWLGISEGLESMTAHARGLGYEGIVLFLDELVLWLGQHLSDDTFIQEETSKVAKLVETGMSTLPVPIVSFVARQRDLKDFLGESAEGAQQAAVGQSFQWWEERFERIELKAADLPRIVKQRLLTPVSDQAEAVLAQALAKVKQSGAAWSYLMTDEAHSGEAEFAQVYPFSPALVDSMVALSSLMQRERTALKLMGELLSDGRAELTASDVIPVGDLFDQIMSGSSEPLTTDMKKRFSIAKSFYNGKFRPFLLNKHGLADADAHLLARGHAFRTEDRLAKTLLIADLAPGAVSLRNLNAAKLAALNYGTITAYVSGAEAQQVLTWVRQWALNFGEVTIGDGNDPLIGIHLSGVDYDSILERVQAEDNPGNRRVLIRDLVTQELGLAGGGMLTDRHLTHTWRGRKRVVTVTFGNVRDENEVSDDDLITTDDEWRVVIDFPYDVGDHSPKSDTARLDRMRDEGVEAQTIAWIPNFLTAERLSDLGKLVKLDHVLLPAQFEQNASHLPQSDREPARVALENQRKSLRASIISALHQAYAVSTRKPADVDDAITGTEVFSTLLAGVTIHPPVADSLLTGIQSALDQVWAATYPKHPQFEPSAAEVRVADLRRIVELVESAVSHGGRAEGLSKADQSLLQRLAVPLKLGVLNENVFVATLVDFGWRDDFSRWNVQADEHPSIAVLRTQLASWGMTTEVEDALISSWALIADREWVRGEASTPQPLVGSLTGDIVLRAANLPTEQHWETANELVQPLLGLTPERNRISAAVRRLGESIVRRARELTRDTTELVGALQPNAEFLGLDLTAPVGRLATARRAAALIDALSKESDPLIAIETLANTDLQETVTALARSIASAAMVHRALSGADWATLRAAAALGDAPDVANAMAALRSAAANEEFVAPLELALSEASQVAKTAVLARAAQAPVVPAPAPTPNSGPPAAAAASALTAPDPIVEPDDIPLPVGLDGFETRVAAIRAEIEAELAAHPGKRVRIFWRLE